MEIIHRMGPNGMMIEIFIPDRLLIEQPRYTLWAELVNGLRSFLFER